MEEYFARAKAWGHRGIAVSDHGSVQAFPDLFHLVKDSGMKALYGLELRLRRRRGGPHHPREGGRAARRCDLRRLRHRNDRSCRSSTTTSSKSPASSSKNGTVIAEYATFVDPEKPINQFTTDLTGITNTDVRKAEGRRGHRRLFSLRRRCGPGRPQRRLSTSATSTPTAAAPGSEEADRPSIDTMTLAKALWPDRQRYSLDSLCKFLKVNLNGHHRAINDAKATAEVFLHMLKEPRNKEPEPLQRTGARDRPESAVPVPLSPPHQSAREEAGRPEEPLQDPLRSFDDLLRPRRQDHQVLSAEASRRTARRIGLPQLALLRNGDDEVEGRTERDRAVLRLPRSPAAVHLRLHDAGRSPTGAT
ncbi:MAG: exonuclease domain-containing protein [Bacillus subtilis]|nr:exonuclease domain-containing protein [Bacillus subtilis]